MSIVPLGMLALAGVGSLPIINSMCERLADRRAEARADRAAPRRSSR